MLCVVQCGLVDEEQDGRVQDDAHGVHAEPAVQ